MLAASLGPGFLSLPSWGSEARIISQILRGNKYLVKKCSQKYCYIPRYRLFRLPLLCRTSAMQAALATYYTPPLVPVRV